MAIKKPTPKTSPTPPPPVAAEYPLVSAMEKKDMKRCVELLEELNTLTLAFDPDSETFVPHDDRLKQVKLELGQLQERYGLFGVRYGNYTFRQAQQEGRNTFDKALAMQYLIEEGIPAEVVSSAFQKATTQGSPFVTGTFKKI